VVMVVVGDGCGDRGGFHGGSPAQAVT